MRKIRFDSRKGSAEISLSAALWLYLLEIKGRTHHNRLSDRILISTDGGLHPVCECFIKVQSRNTHFNLCLLYFNCLSQDGAAQHTLAWRKERFLLFSNEKLHYSSSVFIYFLPRFIPAALRIWTSDLLVTNQTNVQLLSSERVGARKLT